MVGIFRFPRCELVKFNPHHSLRTRLGLVSNLAFVLSVLASQAATAITNPMLAIAKAANRIRGCKQVTIPVLPGDEIESRSKSLSQLVHTRTQLEKDLKASIAQLQMEITAKLVAQQMLRQSEEKFRQLAENLEETRLALEKERETSELKSRFIAIASHEFRTPLTSILLSCDTLRLYSHKLTEEKKHKLFAQIQSSVKHLNQVVEDVLHIGKAQAGKLQFNPVPLHLPNFCTELVEQLQLCAGENYQLNFVSHSYQTPHLPLIDEKLLRQILTNLLTNAIKYSPQGGKIQFDLMCNNNNIIFCIQDQGIGIPKEDQTQLFTSFFRCSNSNLPGTGLGLTIVKGAVELHGGQITVESEEGQGTTFTVILPLNNS